MKNNKEDIYNYLYDLDESMFQLIKQDGSWLWKHFNRRDYTNTLNYFDYYFNLSHRLTDQL